MPPTGTGQHNGNGPALTNQMKLDFIHDTRQAFGRSTLVLQGGAIFGMCHLGVVKALYLRGLLPRIITGTATGALIAALVSIHTTEELPAVLAGEGIDLSAFSNKESAHEQTSQSRWNTLLRRLRRFTREGYFLDVTVLEECVRANVGDLTFEEAYNRSKRVLNITVATEGQNGVPTLLNYLTAPNVVRLVSRRSFPVDQITNIRSSSGPLLLPQMPLRRLFMVRAKPQSCAKMQTGILAHGLRLTPPTSTTGHTHHTQSETRHCGELLSSSTSITSL